MKGKFKLSKKPPEYSNFAVSASGNIVVSAYNAKIELQLYSLKIELQLLLCSQLCTDHQDLSVHTEDLAYMKVDIFSPFWMINKTGLTLEYKVLLPRVRGRMALLLLRIYNSKVTHSQNKPTCRMIRETALYLNHLLLSCIRIYVGGLKNHQTPSKEDYSTAIN